MPAQISVVSGNGVRRQKPPTDNLEDSGLATTYLLENANSDQQSIQSNVEPGPEL